MTEDDRRFVELTAETVSTKVAAKITKGLPCEENSKKIADHDRTLHDGLKKDVEELEHILEDHQQRHHNSAQEKIKGKKAFRHGFVIALIAAAVGGIFSILTVFLMTMVGG